MELVEFRAECPWHQEGRGGVGVILGGAYAGGRGGCCGRARWVWCPTAVQLCCCAAGLQYGMAFACGWPMLKRMLHSLEEDGWWWLSGVLAQRGTGAAL
jgi:hypothetical protein